MTSELKSELVALWISFLVILKQGTNEVLLLFTIISALVPARKLTILNTFENKILF